MQSGAHTFLAEVPIEADIPEAVYALFLSLPDPAPALHDDPRYSIRLANNGLWETVTGFHDLQQTVHVSNGVKVAVRAFLEGPYQTASGLMSDALRTVPTFPLSEPYTGLGYVFTGGGGETTTAPVLATSGNNAIVDWVVVELRSAMTPATVLGSQCALIQRDGDVVATDGVSSITFGLPSTSYHVALRHRNHLGVMTLNPLPLNATPTGVDFSLASTQTYGANARKGLTGTFPAQALWAGDVTFNKQLKYTGSNNDRDPILVAIGGTLPTNTLNLVYRQEDVNLNGVVKYTGTNNDRDPSW